MPGFLGRVGGFIGGLAKKAAPLAGLVNPLAGVGLAVGGRLLNRGERQGDVGDVSASVGDPSVNQQALDLGSDRALARERFFESFDAPRTEREDTSGLFESSNVFAGNSGAPVNAPVSAPTNSVRDLIGQGELRGRAGQLAQVEQLAPDPRADSDLNAAQLLRRRQIASQIGRAPQREVAV